MKAELLRAALDAKEAQRPAVLLRSLDSEERWLFDPADEGAATLPEPLRSHAEEALRRDGASLVEVEGRRYLLQTFGPPYRLILVGAVHIAQVLATMARAAGYAATLVDPRQAFATPERFPGLEIHNAWPQEVMDEIGLTPRSAVVTLSHDPKIDEPALAAALRSQAFYIGALGSRRNHAGRLERLAGLGFAPSELERIAGPVGLDLGGRAPAEIAVSILAQIIQTRYARSA